MLSPARSLSPTPRQSSRRLPRKLTGFLRLVVGVLGFAAALVLLGGTSYFVLSPKAGGKLWPARLVRPARPAANLTIVQPRWYADVSALQPGGLFTGTATADAGQNLTGVVVRLPWRVAMLFLTPGPLPHEGAWADWLAQAEGLVPVAHISALYEDLPFEDARRSVLALQHSLSLTVANGSANAADRQCLFSIYVHTHPEWKGYSPDSIFADRIIRQRIVARRMFHSLVEAEKLLLKEALLDGLNERFVLLSETHLPLYPPTATYLQLITENVSRVDGCHYQRYAVRDNLDRWHPAMCRKKLWRKTSQWFSLTRNHARLVADEVSMNAGFAEHCRPRFDQKKRRFISCSDNEHYPAVVLAASREGRNTACWPGGSTYVDWSRMDREGRPRSWLQRETTYALFDKMRRSQCDFKRCEEVCASSKDIDAMLQSTAHGSFVPVAKLATCCQEWARYEPVGVRCPIFARKFSNATADFMRQFLRGWLTQPAR